MAYPDPQFFRSPEDYYGGFGIGPQPRTPQFLGFNLGSPSSPFESIAQSILPMFAEQLRQQYGGAAFQFGADMNVTSVKYAQQYLLQLDRARTAGAAQDTEQVRQLMSGFARMLGNDIRDPDVQQSIGVLSKDISRMLPMLASAFPDSIDRMFPRGSMAVASQSFVSGGRYIIDPATGMPISADKDFATNAVGELLKRGPEATSGLGAGRLGQIFENLVGVGLIDRGDNLRKDVLAGTISADDAKKIQSREVNDKIAAYSGAIAAINDIFAENGVTNAKMPDLIRGLNKLTSGGFGTVDAKTLANQVRTAQAVSQITGVSMQQMQVIGQEVQSALIRGGMSRRDTAFIAPGLAAYGNLAMQAAAGGGLVFEGPEGQDPNEWRQRALRLSTAGQTSDFGQITGAILSLARYVPEDSDLGKVAVAIRKGDITGGGKLDLRTAGLDEIVDVMKRSGLSDDALLSQLQQREQINAVIADPQNQAGFAEVVSARQATDLRTQTDNQLAYRNFFGKDPNKVYEELSKAAQDRNNKNVADVAKAAGTALGLTADESRILGTDILGAVAGPDGRFLYAMTGDQMRKQIQDLSVKAKGIADYNADTSSLMRGGVFRNIARTIADYGAGTSFDLIPFVLRSLGMVTNTELEDPLFKVAPSTEWLRNVFGYVGGGPLDALIKSGMTLEQAKEKLRTDGIENALLKTGLSPDEAKEVMKREDGVGGASDVLISSGMRPEEVKRIMSRYADGPIKTGNPWGGPTGRGSGGDWTAPDPDATHELEEAKRIGTIEKPREVTRVELKIDVAEFRQEGKGVSISGSGAMFRGDAAT